MFVCKYTLVTSFPWEVNFRTSKKYQMNNIYCIFLSIYRKRTIDKHLYQMFKMYET